MKFLIKLIMLLLIVGLTSCRDTNKEEEAETNAVIEKIDSVESEAEAMSEQLEQEAKELEEAMEELDSI
ncbi:hypothetical protein ATE92_2776 [Ulvibacter sp. MAR_2010_11]|uniref:hypothetical protein n=1 Tax=Ulvibacter sp. MAR_2010_11 TaxID=1250229 RepID=UPI000C2C599D|nr:hypothetical protein [Ulvibacter sp. MAR_2010_11]PKA84579.1 hypothetical protein ATE92_2776 [Ulvibacter sp. MAR_2010_11]